MFFCYGPKKDLEELDIDKAKLLIKKFSLLGAEVIRITGGEPLLYDNIEEIFKTIKKYNIKLALNSNCDFFNIKKNIILKYVDSLEIPIESSEKEVHNKIRGRGSFENILEAIDYSFHNSKIIFKIGTVIIQENYEKLESIEKLLFTYRERVIMWKLYECISFEKNKEFDDKEEIFLKVDIKKLGNIIGLNKIVIDSKLLRSNAYFLVKPDGNIFMPVMSNSISKEIVIGNLLNENIEDILDSWNSLVMPGKYIDKNRCIFRKSGDIN